MMNSQRSDTEKINLTEEGKKISIDEVIKHNEIIKISNIKQCHLVVLFKVQKKYRKYKSKSFKN